jgi:glycosyltransferase involved in cell wall biosynthesis
MKILHIVPYFYPAWSYGGTPKVVFELCREMVRKGHNITVYTTDVFDKDKRLDIKRGEGQGCQETEVDGIKVKYFKNISNRIASNQKVFLSPGMAIAFKKNLHHFDMVHLHEFRTLQNAAAHFYLTRYKIPYILSAHGSVLRIMGKEFLKGLFDISIGFKILKSIKRAVAVSRIEVGQYINMGVPEDKISLIPNGIDLSEFKNAEQLKGKFRGRYGLSDKKIILFIGRLNPIKGIDFLLNTFAILSREDKDTILVIAGPDDGYKKEIQKLLNLFNMNNRLLLIDGLYGEDKIAALVDADVFVYPSRHEIFGITPLEAIACQTPIVITENCGIADFLRKVDGGIMVGYQDISQLLKAIRNILNYREDAKNMALRGQELIRKDFNWDSISEKTIGLYRSILQEG